jgi:hypothetical protein
MGFSCYLHAELWKGPHLDVCGKENCIIFMMTTWCPPKYGPSHMQELCSGASKDSRGNVARPLRLGKWKTCECCRLQKTALFWDLTMSTVVEIHWLWLSEGRTSWCILTMKANEMHYFSNLFDKVLYMFRTGPLSIIRSISTLYTRNRYLSC